MGSELTPVSVRIDLIIGHLADVTKNCLTCGKLSVINVVSVCIKETQEGCVPKQMSFLRISAMYIHRHMHNSL